MVTYLTEKSNKVVAMSATDGLIREDGTKNIISNYLDHKQT